MSVVCASRPFDPSTRRYAAHLVFPSYRHAPGATPHPHTNPRGHSYGAADPGEVTPLETVSWRSHETYLFGVDLYNFAYWWEAHEQWEGLWRLHGRATDTGAFLQGLIQLSAALLKWHAGNRRGFTQLAVKGCAKLERVAASAPAADYMGVNLEPFSRRWRIFAANPQESAANSGAPPLLLLE